MIFHLFLEFRKNHDEFSDFRFSEFKNFPIFDLETRTTFSLHVLITSFFTLKVLHLFSQLADFYVQASAQMLSGY